MISNSMIGITAGICGTLFLGYCIYFDHKRRSDPNYKKMVRERRKANRESKHTANSNRSRPDGNDAEAYQKFFLQEIQLGEEMLSQGDIVNGIEHLANAIEVCSQPGQLLNVLSTSLPPHVFGLLVQRLRASDRVQEQKPATGPQVLGQVLVDEDVE